MTERISLPRPSFEYILDILIREENCTDRIWRLELIYSAIIIVIAVSQFLLPKLTLSDEKKKLAKIALTSFTTCAVAYKGYYICTIINYYASILRFTLGDIKNAYIILYYKILFNFDLKFNFLQKLMIGLFALTLTSICILLILTKSNLKNYKNSEVPNTNLFLCFLLFFFTFIINFLSIYYNAYFVVLSRLVLQVLMLAYALFKDLFWKE